MERRLDAHSCRGLYFPSTEGGRILKLEARINDPKLARALGGEILELETTPTFDTRLDEQARKILGAALPSMIANWSADPSSPIHRQPDHVTYRITNEELLSMLRSIGCMIPERIDAVVLSPTSVGFDVTIQGAG